ncbi:transposase, partial [Schaedlerella arabinosiphila]
MWVHITSELLNTSPIILFCYELTRGTDHLRKFYQDFQGFITCDAYCSYQVLEKEKQEVITVCGCMMHLRRRFANSLALIDKTGLSEEKIRQLPEAQALILIGKIYDADEALKNLSAEERRIQRETT